jgi:septal ring factor EnvC (AmiA/AmiB activator)
VSGELLLALGSVAGAVAAAFATVYAAMQTSRRERTASAMQAYEQVVNERREMTDDLRAEILRLREQLAETRAERDAAVEARDALLHGQRRERGR